MSPLRRVLRHLVMLVTCFAAWAIGLFQPQPQIDGLTSLLALPLFSMMSVIVIARVGSGIAEMTLAGITPARNRTDSAASCGSEARS